MSALNTGKSIISTTGGISAISYGNQSPAVDAVPLSWNAGDWRQYIGTDPTILGWRCTVGGTPGTWVQITLGGVVNTSIIMQLPFVYNGGTSVLNPLFGAPATADWKSPDENSSIYNMFVVPSLASMPGPNRLSLTAKIIFNNPGVTTPNGLTISVVNDSLAIVGAGAATIDLNADFAEVGNFLLFDVPVADVATGSPLGLRVEFDPAIVSIDLNWEFVLTLYYAP